MHGGRNGGGFEGVQGVEACVEYVAACVLNMWMHVFEYVDARV
jgi:hypothetical protein